MDIKQLQDKIQSAYQDGVTMEQAERLAAEFLYAQMAISSELRTQDLDARMRKTGVKAVRAALYTSIVAGSEKKPTEAAIESMINSDAMVNAEQDGFDTAEVSRDELERLYSVFREAHVYFRGIAKGRFE